MSRASDPGDPDHTSHTGVPDTAFRPENDVGITTRPISGLNHRDLLTHCVRFASASHPTNGNTRYRPARYGFDRAGLAPAGLHQEVSLAHPSSSSSALIPARSQIGQQQPYGEVADSGHLTTLSTGVSQAQAITMFDDGADWEIHIGAVRTVLRKHSR
jgi:hypothetical protein